MIRGERKNVTNQNRKGTRPEQLQLFGFRKQRVERTSMQKVKTKNEEKKA